MDVLLFIGKHSSHEGLLGTESPPSQATITSFMEQPGTSVTVTATITTRPVDDDVILFTPSVSRV